MEGSKIHKIKYTELNKTNMEWNNNNNNNNNRTEYHSLISVQWSATSNSSQLNNKQHRCRWCETYSTTFIDTILLLDRYCLLCSLVHFLLQTTTPGAHAHLMRTILAMMRYANNLTSDPCPTFNDRRSSLVGIILLCPINTISVLYRSVLWRPGSLLTKVK